MHEESLRLVLEGYLSLSCHVQQPAQFGQGSCRADRPANHQVTERWRPGRLT